MNSKQTEETACNLSNAELIDRVEKWVHKLAETGGQAWTLRVPVDFNHDPDMLIIEVCKRFSASLPASSPVSDVEEMAKEYAKNSVSKLFSPKSMTDAYYDVSYNARIDGFKSGYAAAPQKGMKELFNKLKREFEFVGDEKISGITALRLIKPIFDESPSHSEAGDGWVSVEDELPEKTHKSEYLVFHNPRYDGDDEVTQCGFHSIDAGIWPYATHWRKRPAPPIQKPSNP